MLRHSTGYALAARGMDTRLLQHFLGHASNRSKEGHSLSVYVLFFKMARIDKAADCQLGRFARVADDPTDLFVGCEDQPVLERPVRSLRTPPHCLKKNRVPACRHCDRIESTHSAFIGRECGPDSPSDVLRQRAPCTACGHKGATLQHPGWGGADVGLIPFPAHRLLGSVPI
jgi:hypothetical protein